MKNSLDCFIKIKIMQGDSDAMETKGESAILFYFEVCGLGYLRRCTEMRKLVTKKWKLPY
jgi:hypothetical protein